MPSEHLRACAQGHKPAWTTACAVPGRLARTSVLPPAGYSASPLSWAPTPGRGPGSPACRPRPSLDQARPGTRNEPRPRLLIAQNPASIPRRVPRVTSPVWTTVCRLPVLPPCGFWVPRPWRGPGSPVCRPRHSLVRVANRDPCYWQPNAERASPGVCPGSQAGLDHRLRGARAVSPYVRIAP